MSPVKVIVYSKPACIYCTKAKKFLEEKNIPFEVIDMDPFTDEYEDQKNELIEKTNQRTFPFVFAGETFLGGYTELVQAFNTLKLHELCGLEMDF